MLLWAACGPWTVVCPPCHEVTVAMVKELEIKFFLVGNNVLTKIQKVFFIASATSFNTLLGCARSSIKA